MAGAYFIEVDRLRPDPAQPRRRLDTSAQEELVRSVTRLGVIQPISVRYLEAQLSYQIISGERRYHAAIAAGLAEVPCWVQTPREEEVLLRQVVENWQRRDLSPFELADALAAMRDAHGHSQHELAELTGKPKSEISKLLSLLKLSPEAQQVARHDPALSRRHLYAISQARPDEHVKLVARVQQGALKAEQTEVLSRRTKPTASGDRRRGTVTTIRRFNTTSALVTVTFRKRAVDDADLATALDEARAQVDAVPTRSTRGESTQAVEPQP